MRSETDVLKFDLGSDAGAAWKAALIKHHGLSCTFDTARPSESFARGWMLGNVSVTQAGMASITLAPARSSLADDSDWLFLKIMTAGYVDIEQGGDRQRFQSGSLFLLDPARAFSESFPESGHMTVLRVSKTVLRDRGLRDSLDGIAVPAMIAPDRLATMDLIQSIARQADAPSRGIRDLMGGQLLTLLDAILSTTGAPVTRRSAPVLIQRAKQHIAEHLGHPALDIAEVASAVHISSKHLQRLFRDSGLSVMRYIQAERLERARQLLHAPAIVPMSVQDIAWQCGFTSAAHFSRAFSSYFGATPSDVRMAGARGGVTPALIRRSTRPPAESKALLSLDGHRVP
ncbi:AraC family transcriptional regulator [Alcaligenaceae bacterium C4P045]|nr:AraC family transcriptional regulator [Alcaligenaceae bacterium C4P045]